MSITTIFTRPLSFFRSSSRSRAKAESVAAPVLDFPNAPPDIRILVRQRQYAHIVRPQDGLQFDDESLKYAWKAIDHDMAYVPGGAVILQGEYATTTADGLSLIPQTLGTSDVESLFIDRWCVTNADYKRFVDEGGYDDVNLWPEQILTTVLQFVDQTQQPGPAGWAKGSPIVGTEAQPVTGVSWYEANAYAQWTGKRLPTSAEWQRAATWSLSSSDSLQECRYPWGNSFDPGFANTWASGRHQVASIHDFPKGNTPDGVRQLVGNVWEWINTQYMIAATEEVSMHATDPMAEIRGGAYDSYFHSHTTCQSRSADTLTARKPNIGFRCCFSATGLEPPDTSN
ncbi:formylglycine-generating enzyme family protein [Roseiconus lacunae]|uniref:formylglycine-generating enzyme family protein n=1 Tax=Roseiconus lacunae TaxID=2605694 RepID=UPI001E34BABB|nr:SUMF1/EgtB/PvdO family nonheme iron enzyme [Roseiconus lacunae]MCD0458109.1 formylglycine-generating enzyme family protein [Roseiconus lacunae]